MGPTFLSIDIPIGYAIRYIQIDTSHTFYGCSQIYPDDGCSYASNYSHSDFYEYSEGVSPTSTQDLYYGGWENITIDYEISIMSYGEYAGYQQSSYRWETVSAYHSMWSSSEYEFTLYYQFIPVIPTE